MQTTQTVPAERGPYLREIRVAADVTQSELAAAAGVSVSHLCRFERGERPVSITHYDALMRALPNLIAKDAA